MTENTAFQVVKRTTHPDQPSITRVLGADLTLSQAHKTVDVEYRWHKALGYAVVEHHPDASPYEFYGTELRKRPNDCKAPCCQNRYIYVEVYVEPNS